MPKNLKTWPGGCTIYINPRVHISKCSLFWPIWSHSKSSQMSDHSSDNSNRCKLLHRQEQIFLHNQSHPIHCEMCPEQPIAPTRSKYSRHSCASPVIPWLPGTRQFDWLHSLLLVMGQVPMSHSDLRCSGRNLLFHRPTLSGQPLLQMSLALPLSGEAEDCSSLTVSAWLLYT